MRIPTIKIKLVDTSAGLMYAMQILKGTELAHNSRFDRGRFSVSSHQKMLGRYGIC